jgi:hypothetical protein
LDDSVFGDEVVTSTALYFRFFLSIEDVKKQAGYDALRIEKNSLNKIKSIQVALLDDLSNLEVGFKTWKKLDDSYFKIASKIKDRLLLKGFPSSTMRIGSEK